MRKFFQYLRYKYMVLECLTGAYMMDPLEEFILRE